MWCDTMKSVERFIKRVLGTKGCRRKGKRTSNVDSGSIWEMVEPINGTALLFDSHVHGLLVTS